MAILGLDTVPKKSIFFLYMGLWSALRLITYASKLPKYGAPEYNQTTLLVFVCIAKLCIAGSMYLQSDGSMSNMMVEWRANWNVFLKYALPALSYVVYDNLTFINLSISDPVTYVILMQMRIAATGIVWSIFFNKPLNRNQWTAIAFLTTACILQKGPAISQSLGSSHGSLLRSVGLIGFQICCGVFSSVFNELLLKEKGCAGVNLQNIFMYVHSIFFNLLWLAICPSKEWCKSDLTEALRPDNLAQLLHYMILPIGLILASIGIVTSLFIKHLDSVRKTIASAIEIFVDALLSFIIFGIDITPYTMGAVVLAAAGIVIYSRPVEQLLISN